MSADLAGFADGWFDEGAVTFETGANAGRSIEVEFLDGVIAEGSS